uniref:Protein DETOXIFICATION n=1 Tax=Oryza punctata TaxID=4537 RepID=A0A0E0K9V1_ORYPU
MGDEEECRVALLNGGGAAKEEDWQVVASDGKLRRRVWEESKKLWVIVAPAIFSRVVTYSMNVITQAFAGHLGDLELAAISIANTVVVGFNFGLMKKKSKGKCGRFVQFSGQNPRATLYISQTAPTLKSSTGICDEKPKRE